MELRSNIHGFETVCKVTCCCTSTTAFFAQGLQCLNGASWWGKRFHYGTPCKSILTFLWNYKASVYITIQKSTPHIHGYISLLHVVFWVSLSGTLSGTLRIVFQSHLVLSASMRIIVRNNFSFCFLHYFSNFFSKFWYFIIVINPIFLANSKNSLTPWMRSKLLEI